ncbi:DUF2336 domain-containing protein [Hyphomonadaceae bacterium BL14]|nr:DUF2336 domain-containing protein [Hyphomonadaceae bacterium BL14]
MKKPSQNLHRLAALSQETSPESRRQMLRDVTDLFIEEIPSQNSTIYAEFDALLQSLAKKVNEHARATLSERLADCAQAPHELVLQLAMDAIAVAGPILLRSSVLNDDDLVNIVEKQNQEHIRAIAERESVSEKVSRAIAVKGDDTSLARLILNEGAKVDRFTFEIATERAEHSPIIQGSLVRRSNTPADLLADLITIVESELREQIIERFEGLKPAVLEAALAASHERLAKRLLVESEVEAARKRLDVTRVRHALDVSLLISLLKEGKTLEFQVGFAELANVSTHVVKRAMDHDSPDGLLLLCKANGIKKADFLMIAALTKRAAPLKNAVHEDLNSRFNAIREMGSVYDHMIVETAQRAIRFMKVRGHVVNSVDSGIEA